MGRLADKLAKASDAIANFEVAVEKDVDAVIERAAKLDAKRGDVMLRKQQQLDMHMTDLAEFGKDLDAFDGKNDHSGDGTNGNAYTGTSPPKT